MEREEGDSRQDGLQRCRHQDRKGARPDHRPRAQRVVRHHRCGWVRGPGTARDRKSTRLNSSHSQISYAVFCLKKKKSKNAAVVRAHYLTHETAATARSIARDESNTSNARNPSPSELRARGDQCALYASWTIGS